MPGSEILKVGDPIKCGPASFSRFVLPFAYEPRKCGKGDDDRLTYHKIERPSDDRWQRAYFTPETAEVVFDRALWCEASNWRQDGELLHVHRGDRTLRVRLGKPRLTLFEWGTNGVPEAHATAPGSGDGKDAPPSDPLRTGFLIVDTWFENPSEVGSGCVPWTLDDLLAFNEHFRYWQMPWRDDQLNQWHCAKGVGSGPVASTYCGFLSDRPECSLRGGGKPPETCKPESLYFERWKERLSGVVEIGTEHYEVIPMNVLDEDPSGKVFHDWLIHSDCRSFVWTCALLDPAQLGSLREVSGGDLAAGGHWIKLVNVDQPGASRTETAMASAFERKWVKKRTYDRWAHFGTLYGFAYHGGALLGEDCKEPPTWKHFGTMYFHQALLLLYLRVTTFRFSFNLTQSTAKWRKGNGEATADMGENFRRLRKQFAQFTNLYQFPLLSNQQQAVEMYSIQRKVMDVGALFEEVKAEIESTHEFLDMETQRAQETASVRLNVVATLGLGLGLVFAVLGMSVVVVRNDHISQQFQWILLLAGMPASVALLLWASSWRWPKKLMDFWDRWGHDWRWPRRFGAFCCSVTRKAATWLTG